jgi:hypothetical protein
LKKLVYYDVIGTALKWSDTFFVVFYLSLCQKCEKVGIIKEMVGIIGEIVGIMTGKVGIIGEIVGIMTCKVGIIDEMVGIITGKVGIIGEKVRIMTDKVGIRSPAAISVRKTFFLRQVSA